MSFTSKQKEAIEILVGLCTSCKEASPLSKLLREYSEMEGKQLDYSGFATITDFLRASDRFYLINRGGMLFVAAKLTLESAHIAVLVNKQKSTKKRNTEGFLLRDGLFDNVNKPHRPNRQDSAQLPRSLSVNTQSYSYNKAYQKRPENPKLVLSNFRITKTFDNAGFPKKNLPPLPSQLAKVVTPTTAPIKSEFEFLSQKPVADVAPRLFPKLNVVQPDLLISEPVEQVMKQPVSQPSFNNDSSSPVEKVTQHFKQTNLADHCQREFPTEEHTNNYFLKVNKNQTAQERLNQIKHSTPKYVPQPIVTKEKEKQKEKCVIPIEWWTSGNYSNMDRLEEYCHIQGFTSPEYKIFTSTKDDRSKYLCRCSVKGVTFTTYPDDFGTENQARDACAAIAVSTIRKQEELAQYPLFYGTSQEIESKIYDIVSEHEAGVFLIEIPNLFREKHKVSLPCDFVNVIRDNKDKFIIDDTLLNHSSVVYLNKTDYDTLLSNKCKNLPELKLPWNEKNWSVFVTFPETTTSVWAILLGPHYFDKYGKLVDRIDKAKLNSPIKIQQGNIYITVVHGDRQRVRVVEKNNDKYLSHFIDSGEHETLSYNQLYVCDPKFLELPAQAFQLKLKGLSLFDKLVGIDFCLSDLSDQAMIANVHSLEYQYKQDSKVEVTLYDTSTDLDINVNDELLNKITETALKPAMLSGKLTSVIITGLQDSGILTAYLKYDSYNYMIKNEIERLIVDESLLQKCLATLDDVNEAKNELFLVWNDMSNEYLRGSIVDIDRNGNTVVLLIDYGTKIIVNKDFKFYRIWSLSKALAIIPPQAIRMRFHNVQIDDPTEMSLIRGYFGPDVDSYAKIIELQDLPSVEIYVKKRGKIVSISQEIKAQMSFEPVK